MKRASITPAGLNVKKITAYLKGQAKNRNAVRITCQGGSVYIFTGYAAFKLPAVLSNNPLAPILATDTVDPKKAAVSVLIAPMKANDEIQQVCNRLFA